MLTVQLENDEYFEQTQPIDGFALNVWMMKLTPAFQHVEKYL